MRSVAQIVEARVVGRELPGLSCHGHSAVHLGLQVGALPTALVPGDADRAVFATRLLLRRIQNGALDFSGEAVHGRRGARFLYLTWGDVSADGSFTMFRRLKLQLADIPEEHLLQAAAAPDTLLVETDLALTAADGSPLCASVRPPRVNWRLVTPH